MPTPDPHPSFYLANIPTSQAGHTLVVDLCTRPRRRIGGAHADHDAVLRAAVGAGHPSRGRSHDPGCNYNATGSLHARPSHPEQLLQLQHRHRTRGPGCRAASTTTNGCEWGFPIPASYTCTTDCWWSVTENFGTGSSPSDRLTLAPRRLQHLPRLAVTTPEDRAVPEPSRSGWRRRPVDSN